MHNRPIVNRDHPSSRAGVIRKARNQAIHPVANPAVSKIIAPAFARLFLPSTVKELARLRAAENMTSEEIKVEQAKMLRLIVTWSYDTVPYYRDSMDMVGVSPDEIRSVEDLTKLPIFTKRDIQESPERFLSTQANPGDMKHTVTSGTTGTPLNLYRDRRVDPLGQATWWQMLDWVGASPFDPVLYLMLQPGRDHSHRTRKPVPRNLIRAVKGDEYLPIDLLLERKTREVLDWVEKANPVVITGYPSLLHILAQMVIQSGSSLRARPIAVFYHSEQMADDTRILIQEAFQVPILSRYGAMEFSAMVAYTCPQGKWHVNSQGFIVEIVDGEFGNRTGEPANHGRIIITDLRNHVMPILRYEIGDIGWTKAAVARCTCGRQGLQLGGIEGRGSDYVVTPSGYRTPALLLQRSMRLQADLFWEYQFRQEYPSLLEVWVIPKSDYTPDLAAELASTVETYFNHELQVRVKVVDLIPREPSGKRPILRTHLHNRS